MEVLRIENVDNTICDACPLRFKCYTDRRSHCELSNKFERLTEDEIRRMQVAKAKKQGHYFPTE